MPSKEDETKYFFKVVETYRNYKRDNLKRLVKTKDSFNKISSKHQNRLTNEGYLDYVQKIEKCIDSNYSIIKQILDGTEKMFDNQVHDPKNKEEEDGAATAKVDIEKIHSVMKTLARDWSKEGQEEREQSYQLILDEIEQIFDHLNSAQRSDTKILVPGAGGGRLAFEIAAKGYECQGNDFSLYMLMASNFVLNKCKQKHCFTIYPFVHQFANHLSMEDQVRPVTFPDYDPTTMPPRANFSMIAGDFLEVYSDDSYKNSQDCVVTCFFLDCAHNILEFIEQIYRVLKSDGIWINLGPLLYHFSDIPRESSIEPSYDMLHNIIEDMGFEFQREDKSVKAAYCQDSKSMLQFYYNCVFFTCRKK